MPFPAKRVFNAFVSLLLTWLVAACGNQGGTNSDEKSVFNLPPIPERSIELNKDNRHKVIQAGFDGVSGGLTTHSFGPFGLALKTSNANNNVYARLNNLVQDIIAGFILHEYVTGSGAEVPIVKQCEYGGELKTTGHVGGDTLNVGDEFLIEFENCGVESGDNLTGIIAIIINSEYSLSAFGYDNQWTLDADVSFINFSIANELAVDFVVDGDMRMVFQADQNMLDYTITGHELYVIGIEEAYKLTEYDIHTFIDLHSFASSIDARFSLGSMAIGGILSIESHLESSGLGAFPHSGYVNISSGASILFVDVLDSINLELTLVTNHTVQDGYPATLTWPDVGIEAANIF